jgi:hypothetical protein
MCDYSLTGVPNRLGVEGEELITYRFPTGSIGLASPADVKSTTNWTESELRKRRGFMETLKYWFSAPKAEAVCAVCIAPGSVLQMSRIPEEFGGRFALAAIEDVTFTQLTAEPFQYRDAIRFRNGRHVLMQSLREGILFKVKCGASSRTPEKILDIRDASVVSRVRYTAL